MAVSRDQFRMVFFQGHPEYDFNSLLKEYRREIARFVHGGTARTIRRTSTTTSRPTRPRLWRSTSGLSALCLRRGTAIPPFPDQQIEPHLDNTWLDTGKSIVNNWLGLVYRLTNIDRKICFIEGVDPDNPLGLRK